LLAAILLLATVVRVHDLGADPPGFFADEASYGYNAYKILHTGKDEHHARMPLFFKAFGEYKLPVYTYSQVPFVAAFGLSELGVRLASAFYGVLTVAALYLLAKRLFDDEAVALGSAAVLAVLPWHIHYSRTGMGENITFVFFLVLSLYLFYRGLERPKLWLLTGLSLAVTLYAYRSAWVTVPPLLTVLGVLYHRELLRDWRYALAGLAIVALAAIPIGVHLLSVDTDRSQEQSIFHLGLSKTETVRQFFDNYRMHFTDGFLLRGEGEINLRHVIPGQGWIYWWQLPFLAAGLIALLWTPTRPHLLVVALLALFPLPAAVSDASPNSMRSVMGVLPMSIITAFGLATAARLLASIPDAPLVVRRAMVAFLLVVVGVSAGIGFASFLRKYEGEYKQLATGYDGWQWGGRAIVERFVTEQNDYDTFLIDGRFNAPGSFIHFYAPDGQCSKCTGAYIQNYHPERSQLFALRPESPWLEKPYTEHGRIYYPDGELAFQLVEVSGPLEEH
jgi:4-amino-4-deoxy-L-arabinose transferase-like glycosyltransferase